jgi:hypothetical protein
MNTFVHNLRVLGGFLLPIMFVSCSNATPVIATCTCFALVLDLLIAVSILLIASLSAATFFVGIVGILAARSLESVCDHSCTLSIARPTLHQLTLAHPSPIRSSGCTTNGSTSIHSDL